MQDALSLLKQDKALAPAFRRALAEQMIFPRGDFAALVSPQRNPDQAYSCDIADSMRGGREVVRCYYRDSEGRRM